MINKTQKSAIIAYIASLFIAGTIGCNDASQIRTNITDKNLENKATLEDNDSSLQSSLNRLNKKQTEQIRNQIKAYEKQRIVKLIKIPFAGSTLELLVDPLVADPEIMNSGVQTIKYLEENPYLVRGKIVTDMGSGCGIIGLAAAKLGAKKVYMMDIDPNAVRNTQENIQNLHLEKSCEVFESDLFTQYGNRDKSEVQIFNHPFFAAEPLKDKAWTQMMLGGTQLIGRYFKEAPKHSTSTAVYIMPWLTFAGNSEAIDNDPGKRCLQYGYQVTKVTEQSPVVQGIQKGPFRIYLMKK
jgi:predicted RNA methylase